MKKYFIIMVLYLGVYGIVSTQCTTLHNFTGNPDGKYSYGSLIYDGTFLYGMTWRGGIFDAGTIFKITPNGSGYVKLLDFNGVNGSEPVGSLFSDGTFLYGMTSGGGAYNQGTVFKIMPDGSGYIKLLDFDGTTNGSIPYGSLISDSTFLYGMTGGGFGMSTIFKVMPDGSGYFKLWDFNDTIVNEQHTIADLIYDGTYLYGMTFNGGSNGMGTIFKIMPDGSGYIKLYDFDGLASGFGCYPQGSLFYDGTFLYGMAGCGTTGDGTIFKIMPDGSGGVKLFDFAGGTICASPGYGGSLISDGTFLYGMGGGGIYNQGTLFKIMPDGSGVIKLFDFHGTTGGVSPSGSPISDGTFLYGMTRQGGTNNLGTVFKFDYSTIGIEENNSETSLHIYPNPATGKINIVCANEQKDAKLEIVNMVGQTIISIKNINLQEGENYQIDLSYLSIGSYILQFQNFRTVIIKN